MELDLSKVIPFILIIFATLTAISSMVKNIPDTIKDTKWENDRANAERILASNNNISDGQKFKAATIYQDFGTMNEVYNNMQKEYNSTRNNESSFGEDYIKASAQMGLEHINENYNLNLANKTLQKAKVAQDKFNLPSVPEVDLAEFVINNEKIPKLNPSAKEYPSCEKKICTIEELFEIKNNNSAFIQKELLFYLDNPENNIYSVTNPAVSFVNATTLVFLLFLVITPIVTTIAIKGFLIKKVGP